MTVGTNFGGTILWYSYRVKEKFEKNMLDKLFITSILYPNFNALIILQVLQSKCPIYGLPTVLHIFILNII